MASFQDTIKILIQADGAKAVSEMERVGKTAQREMDRTNKATRDWGATLTRTGAGLVGFAAVAGVALFRTAEAADDAAQASLRLDNTMRNQPKLAGASRRAFDDLAKAVAKKTVVDDDAVISAQALLGQFSLTQDQILKLTPLIVDLSRKMGVDLDSAAKAVGKAMGGSAGALKRFGIDIGDVEKGADNTEVVIKGLARTVGGFAENEAKTFSGQMQQAKRDLGEVAEAIGAGVIPVFTELLGPVKSLTEKFSELDPATQSLVGRIAAVAVVASGTVGSLALLAGQAQKMRAALSTTDLATGVTSLSTFGKVAVGAGAAAGILGTAWVLMGQKGRQAKADVDNLVAAIRSSGKSAGEVAAQQLAEYIGANEDVQATLDATRLAVSDVSKAVLGTEKDYGRVTSALKEYGALQDDVILSPSSTQEERAVARARLADAQRLLKSLKEQRDAFFGARAEIKATNAAAKELAGTELDGTKAADELGTAHDDLGGKLDKTRRKVDEVVSAWDRLESKVTRRGRIRDAATAQLDVADALAQVTEAQARYNELAQSGTTTQEELAAAQRDITRATIDYYGSVDDATKSLIDGAAAQAGYRQNAENSAEKTEAFKQALLRMRDTVDGPLRAAIEEHINRINRVPTKRSTKFEADTSQARAALGYLKDTIEGIRRNLSLPINVNTQFAGFAAGGPVSGGVPIIVGERGPEVFVPPSNGEIVPNHQLGTGGRAFAGTTVGNVTYLTVNVNGPVTSKRDAERWIADALKSARRRGDRDVA